LGVKRGKPVNAQFRPELGQAAGDGETDPDAAADASDQRRPAC
jgi:hypothetical protein